MYKIRMGVPEMSGIWTDLSSKADKGLLNKNEQILFRKLVKTLSHLRENPRYPALKSHEISALSKRMGFKGSLILKIENLPPDASSGHMVRTKTKSRYWEWSRIQKAKKEGPMIGSNFQTCRIQLRSEINQAHLRLTLRAA